ncbi:MAG: 4-hydroxy-3-methylbut-2-enyl diphosphate reductase [Candidatus Rifleibacteriota bacterium]
MEIILAKSAGFCMGVKRAMQLALQTAKISRGGVYTCGPLIHNPQAVQYLMENGVESLDNWKEVSNGTMIIRAHGMPEKEIEEMKARGLGIVDATCPHVVTSQKQIRKYSNQDYFIIIIGDKEHPEILSLQSFAKPGQFIVISSFQEAISLQLPEKIMIIAQTTFNNQEFIKISGFLSKKIEKSVVCNSICQATSERQEEIKKLAAHVEAVVVVGGKASANTRRLAEIAASMCSRTYHVETETELQNINFRNVTRVAVTAGASTPDFITDKIIAYLQNFK